MDKLAIRLSETKEERADGGKEFDMAVNPLKVLIGDGDHVREAIRVAVETLHAAGASGYQGAGVFSGLEWKQWGC